VQLAELLQETQLAGQPPQTVLAVAVQADT
jgi:hypothetical protein